jgi:hypothetical protein
LSLSWPNWLGALTFGALLVLLALIVSWMLRACAPVAPMLNVATLQAEVPPAPPAPADPTPVLKASLEQAAADGASLTAQRAKLEAELKDKLAACRPANPPQIEPPKVEAPKPAPPVAAAPLPAERWAKKDLALLEGCWVLGHPVAAVRGDVGMTIREENCTRTAGRICFDGHGVGQHEMDTTCPRAGSYHCVAPIQARFGDDGAVHTTQPRVFCSDASTNWLPYEHTCRRISDSLAICRSSSFQGFPSRELEFRRAP